MNAWWLPRNLRKARNEVAEAQSQKLQAMARLREVLEHNTESSLKLTTAVENVVESKEDTTNEG